MPSGIPYIVGNEAAERFSFYGMRAILFVFMTDYLRNSTGELNTMSPEDARLYYHLFNSAVYFFPLAGAILADTLLGKYRTIISLSIVYCLGHLALALDTTRLGLTIGLTLIAIGSGGIKPCVSSHVGDQFGSKNQHLIARVFGWFYIAINFGAFFASLLIPYLLSHFGPERGPHIAFGLPGALMLLATFVFWLGRNKFVHVPASGMKFFEDSFNREGLKSLASLFVIYLFMAVFWALFDQMGSSWIEQAKHMDRYIQLGNWSTVIEPAQTHAANPFLILVFVPVFTYVVYPALNRLFKLTPLRKINIGFYLAGMSFVVTGLIQNQIAAGHTPHIAWQFLAYIFLTAGEVMASITILEFSYTQAPRRMKAVVMAAANFSVSLGNGLVSVITAANQGLGNVLVGSTYFFFWAGLIFTSATVFIYIASTYQDRSQMQDEAAAD